MPLEGVVDTLWSDPSPTSEDVPSALATLFVYTVRTKPRELGS